MTITVEEVLVGSLQFFVCRASIASPAARNQTQLVADESGLCNDGRVYRHASRHFCGLELLALRPAHCAVVLPERLGFAIDDLALPPDRGDRGSS
jgi:hypothetical protein